MKRISSFSSHMLNSKYFPYPAAEQLEIDVDMAYDKANYHQSAVQRHGWRNLPDGCRWGWCFWWANIFFSKRT
jgi:hypothetical protein